MAIISNIGNRLPNRVQTNRIFLKDEPYMFSIWNKFQQRFDIKRRTRQWQSQVQK